MLEKIGVTKTTERDVYYINTHKTTDWKDHTALQHWVLFSVSDDSDKETINDFVESCLDNNVGYVCTAGKQCELVHDWFDETIVYREIILNGKADDPDSFKESPMSTWHYNFNQGFWWACTNTFDDDKGPFDKIVCIDMTTQGVKKHLTALLEKINAGWLPSDEEFEEPVYDQ